MKRLLILVALLVALTSLPRGVSGQGVYPIPTPPPTPGTLPYPVVPTPCTAVLLPTPVSFTDTLPVEIVNSGATPAYTFELPSLNWSLRWLEEWEWW